ncbi:hypothetical protein SCLCIDRAFT_34921, partial [Scleroderma citrinum Foug A]
NLGRTELIIGSTWLNKHNLEINWQTGEIHEKYPWIPYPVPKGHPRDDGSEQLFRVKKAASWADLPKEAPKKSTKELIPKEYHEFLHTFEQKASE